MKTCIYTVITGNYDALRSITFKNIGFDYICFTNNPSIKSDEWQIRQLDNPDVLDQKMLSRLPKILSHKFLPEYEVTIYIDANYIITKDVQANYVDHIPKEVNFSVEMHPNHWRRCIYNELEKCLEYGHDTKEMIDRIYNKYKREGMPRNYGLARHGIIFRRRSEFTENIETIWWREICENSYRDQLSFMYLVWKYDLKKNQKLGFTGNLARKSFALTSHAPIIPEDFKLYEFVPYGVGKNIGKALNEHCAIVPNEDDWICIRDRDTAWLTHNYGDQVRACIKRYPDTSLFSCYTNRLGLRYQRINGVFDDDPNYTNHIKKAEDLQKLYWDECVDCKQPTAGFLMIFQKKIWAKIKFDEGSIVFDGNYFDYRFTNQILLRYGKIRLMKGVYMWHEYRLGKQTASGPPYKKHLE